MTSLIHHSNDLFDKIEKYYSNGGQLKENEQKICERLESAYATLVEHKSKSVAVNKHMAIFDISKTQAYIDLKSAERIFNPLRKYSKEFMRLVIIESALRDIKQCEKKARKEKDTYLWRAIMQIKDRAEQRIIKAAGLEHDDPNLPDFSKIQAHQFEVRMPEEAKQMFKAILSKGSVDISTIYKSLSEDANIIDDEKENH